LRYTEHLVFALHVHAFWFVALLFALPDWGPLTALALLAVPVHTLFAMKRVYGGGLGPRLLRACLVSALYGMTLGLALAGVALVSLLS
jgi:succinate dehydrogenase hydrophobic anchor subunit